MRDDIETMDRAAEIAAEAFEDASECETFEDASECETFEDDTLPDTFYDEFESQIVTRGAPVGYVREWMDYMEANGENFSH